MAHVLYVQPRIGSRSVDVHAMSQPPILKQLHATRQLALQVHERAGSHVGMVSAVLHSRSVSCSGKEKKMTPLDPQ